jgi:hypothetical protein
MWLVKTRHNTHKGKTSHPRKAVMRLAKPTRNLQINRQIPLTRPETHDKNPRQANRTIGSPYLAAKSDDHKTNENLNTSPTETLP